MQLETEVYITSNLSTRKTKFRSMKKFDVSVANLNIKKHFIKLELK